MRKKFNNLKVLLLDGGGTSKPLIIRAVLNRRVIGECLLTDSDDMAADQEKDINTEKMLGWLTECGMNSDTVIMCDFVYDADLPRTSEACDKINNIFEEIREKYGYLYQNSILGLEDILDDIYEGDIIRLKIHRASKNDVDDLINAASERGIKVIFE